MRSIVVAFGLFLSTAPALPVGAGDAAEGHTVFDAKCANCHSLDPTTPGNRGPHLAGLFDRRYGAVEGFHYRMVWTDADPLWTREHLSNYLDIHHLPDEGKRADLIEFLFEATQK